MSGSGSRVQICFKGGFGRPKEASDPLDDALDATRCEREGSVFRVKDVVTSVEFLVFGVGG